MQQPLLPRKQQPGLCAGWPARILAGLGLLVVGLGLSYVVTGEKPPAMLPEAAWLVHGNEASSNSLHECCYFIMNKKSLKVLEFNPVKNQFMFQNDVQELALMPQQLWALEVQHNGVFYLRNVGEDAIMGAIAKAHMYFGEVQENAAGRVEKFSLHQVGDAYIIQAQATALVLDVPGGSVDNFKNIQLFTQNDPTSNNQLFKLLRVVVDVTTGTEYTILNGDGKVMDLAGGNTDHDTPINQFRLQDSANQHFSVLPNNALATAKAAARTLAVPNEVGKDLVLDGDAGDLVDFPVTNKRNAECVAESYDTIFNCAQKTIGAGSDYWLGIDPRAKGIASHPVQTQLKLDNRFNTWFFLSRV